MWVNLEEDEISIIIEALSHCNLHGLNFLLKSKIIEGSPINPKHTKNNAIKAAQTYFSATDLEIKDDAGVEWSENGDALVMSWQLVPHAFIVESDCGCGK